jgi:hypothetical protein
MERDLGVYAQSRHYQRDLAGDYDLYIRRP